LLFAEPKGNLLKAKANIIISSSLNLQVKHRLTVRKGRGLWGISIFQSTFCTVRSTRDAY